MQKIKTISFGDSRTGRSRIVPISFSAEEYGLYEVASNMTSIEIKEAIGFSDYNLLADKAAGEYRNISQMVKLLLDKYLKESKGYVSSSEVTFRASKEIPFQRWYPYIQGYSPNFVKTLISKYIGNKGIIYEPFAGTGTTIFAADSMGYDTCYSEVNPLLRLLIDTKIKILKLPTEIRKQLAEDTFMFGQDLLRFSQPEDKTLDKDYKNVFNESKYFPEENYRKILRSKTFVNNIESPLQQAILTIAVLSSLIPSSLLKKQGDLRFKTKAELAKGVDDFNDVFANNMNVIVEDLANVNYSMSNVHKCVVNNAKYIGNCKSGKFGSVISSPPYLNGTNYVRNTKLELWFMGLLKSKADLRFLRDEMLTSGINDVKAEYAKRHVPEGISTLYDSTISELQNHSYDKRIPLMAQCYFSEMRDVFLSMRNKLQNGALVLLDIGDSMFNNVHIRTDDILAEIFESLGYVYLGKDKLRERRSRNGKVLSQTLIKFRYGRV